MKRIYLDWGVVSNLKKQECADLREFLLSNKKNFFFVYSPAHFEDAMRSEGDGRFYQDIQVLESLVDNHLLAYENKKVHPFLANPTQYYSNNKGQDLDSVPDVSELLSSMDKEIPLVGDLLKSLMSMPFPIPGAARSNELIDMILPDLPELPSFYDVIHSYTVFTNNLQNNKDFYKSFRSKIRASGFNVEPNAGSWKPEEVVPNITSRLKLLGIEKTFREFVLSGFGDEEEVDIFKFFIAAYNLLDLVGYQSDKLPKTTNAMKSVTTDAQHAFYAAFCDCLITQDKRLANKARALYNELKISTKVLSPSKFMRTTDLEEKDDLVLFLKNQIREDHVERFEEGAVVYKFDRRFLGIFSHCVAYKEADSTLLEFKLEFDNYSYFVFYEEAGLMTDAVVDYFGRPNPEEYEVVRERIVAGDTTASINWQAENVFFTLLADPERHRPELLVRIDENYNRLKNGELEK